MHTDRNVEDVAEIVLYIKSLSALRIDSWSNFILITFDKWCTLLCVSDLRCWLKPAWTATQWEMSRDWAHLPPLVPCSRTRHSVAQRAATRASVGHRSSSLSLRLDMSGRCEQSARQRVSRLKSTHLFDLLQSVSMTRQPV